MVTTVPWRSASDSKFDFVIAFFRAAEPSNECFMRTLQRFRGKATNFTCFAFEYKHHMDEFDQSKCEANVSK